MRWLYALNYKRKIWTTDKHLLAKNGKLHRFKKCNVLTKAAIKSVFMTTKDQIIPSWFAFWLKQVAICIEQLYETWCALFTARKHKRLTCIYALYLVSWETSFVLLRVQNNPPLSYLGALGVQHDHLCRRAIYLSIRWPHEHRSVPHICTVCKKISVMALA